MSSGGSTPFAGYRPTEPEVGPTANRTFWDRYASDYLAEHGEYLGAGDLLWCPEGLRESEAGLLGDIAGCRAVEIGCGAGQGSRWVNAHGGTCVGVDLSRGMLSAARRLDAAVGVATPLLQADARSLPLATGSVDVAFSAFGALPFIGDLDRVHREVARVLVPGGRWVFSVTHPIRWAFLDDPGEVGLHVVRSYFDTTPYVEDDESGRLDYAEYHHTVAEHVESLLGAGFTLTRLLEPRWMPGVTHVWGGWSPERGEVLPGTLILAGHT